MITALYAGVLALFAVFLILRIVRLRFKHKVGLGTGDVHDLTKAVRIHGNFIEMVPILLILMLIMEYTATSALYLHIFGGCIVLSRILHFIGITQTHLTSKGRFLGTILALSLLTIGGITVVVKYFTWTAIG